MTKEDLLKDKGNVDVAMPFDWIRDVKDLGIDPRWYAMDYSSNVFGCPVNLLELYVKKLEETNAVLEKRILELEKSKMIN